MSFSEKRKTGPLYVIALLCIFSLIIAGCGSASKHTAGEFKENMAGPGETDSMNSGSKGEEVAHSAPERQPGENQIKPCFIIRTGSLELTVPDTGEAMKKIESMTAASGGVVGESRIYELREGQYSAELTLRIPEIRFDRFITRLQELGETANLHKSSEDASLLYLDLETRIKNLKAEEKRLREILTEAKTVDDLLKIERELFRVRGEIETMTTEFTYLQDQIAFSTIELYIKEKDIAGKTISQKPFADMGKRLREALYRSINFISSAAAFFLIALVTLLPILVIVTLIAGAVVWVIRAGRQKRKERGPGGQPPMVS